MSTRPPVTTPETPDRAHPRFHPPLLLGTALVAGFGFRRLAPFGFFPSGWTSVGWIVMGGSFVLFAWALLTLYTHRTSVRLQRPTRTVVTAGPFRFSRNPIYLSMLVLLLGVGIWADSLWFPALAAISAVLLTRGVIVHEEAYLERKFGDTYTTYKTRVRRWI